MRWLSIPAIALVMTACDRFPLEQPGPVDAVVSWDGLYMSHCAGCHGADGSRGPARPMADSTYLATISREQLVKAIGSGQGTLMPAFAQAAGGPLSSAELDRLVDGMRQGWGKQGRAAAVPWAAAEGDRAKGAGVYADFCQGCHGQADGRAPGVHGSVTDPNYLRLVSDQALRSAVLFGRPDLGAGCTGPFEGRPAERRLDAQEVSDVVAFLASCRPSTGRSSR